MTKQSLPLDRFEPILTMANLIIDAMAEDSLDEIRGMFEFARRSLGQRTRRAIERIGA